MLYKNHIRIIILRTSVFDIVNDRPPYRIRDREGKRLMRFMLDNGKFFIVPVEVAKPEIFDIAHPQPKNTCKQDHSVIPFPNRACAVNCMQQLLQFLCCPYRWYL